MPLFFNFATPAAAATAASAVLKLRTVSAVAAGRFFLLLFRKQVHYQGNSHKNSQANPYILHKIPPLFSAGTAAAGAMAAAFASFRTADTFDALFLCLVNIARCSAEDQSQNGQNDDVFHIASFRLVVANHPC